MGAIRIEKAGLLTTVQDAGRQGYGPIGVSPSGAADSVSLRLGNLLVGNDQDAAGLEMTLLGATFVFPEGAVLALTGSDFGATLDDVAVEVGRSIEARPGQTLRLGASRSGARCYLCVGGGILTEPFLGSASTHLLSGLGGFKGRAMRSGDILRMGSQTKPFRPRKIAARVSERLAPQGMLRVTPGPQADWFATTALRFLYEAAYRVGEQSDRMGLRLEGAAIPMRASKSMITEGVSLGAVQAPQGSAPIILFVEHQTTGGYPKIANVIAADLHRVGQLRPRDEVRFGQVTFEAARTLLIEQETMLAAGVVAE